MFPAARPLSSKFGPSKTGDDEMKAEFIAIIEKATEGRYRAICPEVPGANGQDEAVEETENNHRQAIELEAR